MASELISGSNCPSSSPGWEQCSVPERDTLFSQVYKWVPANLMLGVTLRWTGIPSRGGIEIHVQSPSRFMLQKLEISRGPWATGSHADFTF